MVYVSGVFGTWAFAHAKMVPDACGMQKKKNMPGWVHTTHKYAALAYLLHVSIINIVKSIAQVSKHRLWTKGCQSVWSLLVYHCVAWVHVITGHQGMDLRPSRAPFVTNGQGICMHSNFLQVCVGPFVTDQCARHYTQHFVVSILGHSPGFCSTPMT